MKPSGFNIILVSLAICVVGILFVPRLSFDFLPTQSTDSIQISFSYPQAPPAQIEESVTTPIESAVSLISGVKSVKSVSQRGYGYINADIDSDVSIDFVRYEIAAKIREIYATLPREVPFPRIQLNSGEYKELETILMAYSVFAPIEVTRLFDYTQEQIAPQLSLVEGIERIEVSGGNEQEWVITFDEDRLITLGLSPAKLQTIIINQLTTAHLSYHKQGDDLLYVRLLPKDVDQLNKLLYNTGENSVIPLSEVINIQKEEAIPTRFYRINGDNSIRLNIIPQEGSNHLDLAQRVREKIRDIQSGLPESYDLHLDYDMTDYIKEELDKIRYRSVWSLGILFLFVVMAYRSWRDVLIIFLSLIVNLSAAAICYHLLEVRLNLYALAAVTISFGVIIDNAIVMSHHYQREGNINVLPAIITSTLTTITALLVILVLPDDLKLELIDFAKVLVVNLSISVLICYAAVPALVDLLSGATSEKKNLIINRKQYVYRFNQFYNRLIFGLRRRRIFFIGLVILLFGLPVHFLPTKWGDHTWYNKTLGDETYVEYVRPWVNKTLGGTLRLFSQYVYEGSGYRSAEETKLHVYGALPEGSTLDQMNDVLGKIEAYVGQYEASLDNYITRVNSGQSGSVVISFADGGNSSFPYILKSRLQSFAIDLGGAKWNIYGVGKAFSNASSSNPPGFTVHLKGYNKEKLKGLAADFAILLKDHPRVQTVDEDANLNWWDKDKYQYNLEVDRRALAQLPSYINLADQMSVFNQQRRHIGTDYRDVAIKMISSKQKDLWAFNNVYRYQDSIAFVMGSLASLTKEKMANAIHKEDQSYIKALKFEYTGSYRFGQKHLDECLAIIQPQLPLGYSISQQSYSFWGAKEKTKYGLLVLVVIAIFFIASIHFESLKTAALLILLIPLSFIGTFLIFYWSEAPFDQGGYVSFLLLSGIVVNALILVLSDYHRLRARFPWRKPIDLYLRAFRMKSTPIYLTVLSTTLGLLPFLFHGQDEVFWFALALGAIGGLIFSLVVLTLVVPLFISTKAVRAKESVDLTG